MGKSLKKDRKFPEKKQGLEKNRWHYLFEDECYLIIFDLGFGWFMMASTCTQCVNSKISNNPTGEAKSQPIRFANNWPWGTQSRSFCGTRVVHWVPMKHQRLSLTSGALAHGLPLTENQSGCPPNLGRCKPRILRFVKRWTIFPAYVTSTCLSAGVCQCMPVVKMSRSWSTSATDGNAEEEERCRASDPFSRRHIPMWWWNAFARKEMDNEAVRLSD